MEYIKILILVILIIATTSSAQAAGIQVSPNELDFELDEASFIQKQLVMANPTSDVQLLEIYPDAYEKLIVPNPASFTLEAGERKVVKIAVNANKTDLKTGQSLATNLSVIAKPLSSNGLTISAGVKIPVRITLKQAPAWNYNPYFLWGTALLAIIATGYLLKRRNGTPHG